LCADLDCITAANISYVCGTRQAILCRHAPQTVLLHVHRWTPPQTPYNLCPGHSCLLLRL
jgi:hypothetical protein